RARLPMPTASLPPSESAPSCPYRGLVRAAWLANRHHLPAARVNALALVLNRQARSPLQQNIANLFSERLPISISELACESCCLCLTQQLLVVLTLCIFVVRKHHLLL